MPLCTLQPLQKPQGLCYTKAGAPKGRSAGVVWCKAVSQPAAAPGRAAADRRSLLLALPAAAGAALLAAAVPVQAKPAGSAGDWTSPGLAAPEDDDAPRFLKLDNGVKVQVLAEGAGPEAAPGDKVLLDYVLRRSNGYFIYSTVEGVGFQPRDVPVGPVALSLGDGSVVPGLEAALVGMRPGGRRRLLIPPEVGYTAGAGLLPAMPTFATQRQLENHKAEPLLFEVQLLRVNDQRG